MWPEYIESRIITEYAWVGLREACCSCSLLVFRLISEVAEVFQNLESQTKPKHNPADGNWK